MKKNIYLLAIIAAISFAGCSQKTKMVNFIPTPTPSLEQEEDSDLSEETTEDAGEDNSENTPTTKPIGKTTVKYVKLDGYDATLNVRKTPSVDGEKVGFLVHTEKVDVIDIVDGWASIVYNDEVCYVKADYLVDERPKYISPPTLAPEPEIEENTDQTTDQNTSEEIDPNAAGDEDPNAAPPEI